MTTIFRHSPLALSLLFNCTYPRVLPVWVGEAVAEAGLVPAGVRHQEAEPYHCQQHAIRQIIFSEFIKFGYWRLTGNARSVERRQHFDQWNDGNALISITMATL